ncbi:MBL fold metallo-hydrolase [Glaciihabitans tibetensis]|nr:MBL fold metallo-hydrolase [Glaciihabitans tibetensis]
MCAICADERQWVPPGGQRWTTLDELRAEGVHATLTELEENLFGVETTPRVGIGQQMKVLRTPDGNVVWDPVGFVDDEVVQRVRELGPVRAIAASHPHMYGTQVEWSRALGDAPVLVATADAQWIARPDPVIRLWSELVRVLPGVTIAQIGGHFPGSAVVHWDDGAEGRGVLLSGDTVFANPDRASVSFMRSFPNHLPLSAATVDRVARSLDLFRFDRLYGNFDIRIDAHADEIVRRSVDRHIGWVTGAFDHLT